MRLTQADIDFINSNYQHLKVTDSKILFKGTTVPSKMYPISNKKHMDVFYIENTEEYDNELIETIFNNQEIKIGGCYDNVLNMVVDAYKNYDVNTIIPYCGWVYVGADTLSHHSWIVVDKKHIIDGGASWVQFATIVKSIKEGLSDKELRQKIIDAHFESADMPNSKKYVFGKTLPNSVYIGCPCDPRVGREEARQLFHTNKKHPSYQGNDSKGYSPLQQQIRARENNLQ